jgi:hypothetical protein
MTFADPFALPIAEQSPAPKTIKSLAPKTSARALRRRVSSKLLVATDVPPVPAIPPAYLSSQPCSPDHDSLCQQFRGLHPRHSSQLSSIAADPNQPLPIIPPHSPVHPTRRKSAIQHPDVGQELRGIRHVPCHKPSAPQSPARNQVVLSTNDFYVFPPVTERIAQRSGPSTSDNKTVTRRTSMWSKLFSAGPKPLHAEGIAAVSVKGEPTPIHRQTSRGRRLQKRNSSRISAGGGLS